MDTWMALGSFSDEEHGEGRWCPGGWLPGLQVVSASSLLPRNFLYQKGYFSPLKEMSLPLKSFWSLGATYQVSFIARKAEIILTMTTLLGKTKSERHP